MKNLVKNVVKVALPLSLVWGATAHAYTTYKCGSNNVKWSSNTLSVRAAINSFPVGAWRDSLATAVSRWNQNPSKFRFSLSYNDTSVGQNNNQNEIWFTSSDIGAPAMAYTRWNCSNSRFIEGDIAFMNTVNYTTSMSKSNNMVYDGSNRTFQTTAMHELGHVLGLGHTSNTYNIMGEDFTVVTTNGSTSRSYAGEDGVNGAVALYGRNSGVIEDLSVTHWRRSGTLSGGYSNHSRTRVFNSSGGTVLSSYTLDGEPVYRVNKGQAVQVEFTYENNGETTKTIDVDYRVSTNDYISPSDTYIGGRTDMTLGRNTAFTFKAPVTIPSNLTSGTVYWIGAIVDADNEVSEITESNNRSYVAVRIN